MDMDPFVNWIFIFVCETTLFWTFVKWTFPYLDIALFEFTLLNGRFLSVNIILYCFGFAKKHGEKSFCYFVYIAKIVTFNVFKVGAVGSGTIRSHSPSTAPSGAVGSLGRHPSEAGQYCIQFKMFFEISC